MEEVSLQEATAEISLQSNTGDQKGAGESIPKALSIPRWKGKNILLARKDMIMCVIYSSCLSANEAKPEYLPQTYGGGIYFHGHRLVSWVWLRLTKPKMGICG